MTSLTKNKKRKKIKKRPVDFNIFSTGGEANIASYNNNKELIYGNDVNVKYNQVSNINYNSNGDITYNPSAVQNKDTIQQDNFNLTNSSSPTNNSDGLKTENINNNVGLSYESNIVEPSAMEKGISLVQQGMGTASTILSELNMTKNAANVANAASGAAKGALGNTLGMVGSIASAALSTGLLVNDIVQGTKLADTTEFENAVSKEGNRQFTTNSSSDLLNASQDVANNDIQNVDWKDVRGQKVNVGSAMLNGMSAGASTGTAIAPGLGTLIGAGAGLLVGLKSGLFTNWKMKKKAKEKAEQINKDIAIAEKNRFDNLIFAGNKLQENQASNALANYGAYGGLFNRFGDGGYTGPIYVDPNKVVQSYVSTAPTKAQRFKNRATMIGEAFADFLPSKEDVTTDIVANKFVPKVSNKLGIVSKIVNVPDTVAKIENLKKAFNLPYSEGLIEAGKGKTLLDYSYTKNKFNDGGPKNENTDLDVSIPKDRPRSVKKNLEFLQDWANSPVTQELWKQNEIDTAAFEDQKELNRTNNKIRRLEEIIEEDKKHYGSAYEEGNSEEKLELNKLRSEELTSNIDEAKNRASQKSMDEVRSDMAVRLQSSFDSPLYIYEGNKEWGIENMTEKEKEDYQKLKNKVNKLYKESSKRGGSGGSDTKTGATITSYRNEDVLKSNPLHEFLHPGWSGTTKTMSAPSLKMEQILREEGLYEDDYWDSGDEGYSRLMDFRLLNNLDSKDRKWTEERVNTEIKNKGYKILDRYGARVTSRLLNEVSYNNPSNLDIEIPEQMEYININPNDNISFAAEGGPIFREFNNGITIINEGGRHEFIIGQEYDVTDEEIKLLKKLGYEFEYI